MAFRGLQAESIAQGQAHLIVSKELHSLVADPFTEWAQVYKVQIGIRSPSYLGLLTRIILGSAASE